MSRETVKTVPPWVIRRPPQTVSPQRNHDPSDAHHSQGRSRDTEPSGNGKMHANENGNTEGLGKPTTAPREFATTIAAAKPSPHDSPAPGLTKTAPTSAEAPSAEWSGGLGHRLSLLFRRKEGRRWDHLRSAEPVIVPQYHVTQGPAVYRTNWDRHGSSRSDRPGGGRAGVGAPGSRTTAAAATAAAAASASSTYRRPTSSPATTVRTPWWYNPESQWHTFIESTRYPHLHNEKSEVVDDEEMQRLNMLEFGYHTPLRPRVGGGDGGGGVGQFHHKMHIHSTLADKPVWERVWHLLLHHPLVPLACRLTVLMTSIVALAMAIKIFRRERLGTVGKLGGISLSNAPERTQVIVAIVIDVVAVPYIGYTTADDFTGKPLGLRPPADRIRLILMDLFFIIFKSASTALGFEALIYVSTNGSESLLRALGAFELIGLVSWVLTLTINVFRVIERLSS